jgi:hypothetical protein
MDLSAGEARSEFIRFSGNETTRNERRYGVEVTLFHARMQLLTGENTSSVNTADTESKEGLTPRGELKC